MNIGMNFQKPTLDNPEGLRRLDLRWALFLADPEEVWNDTTHLWPQVKELCPRCQPVVRFYRPDVMGKSPAFRAGQFCVLLNDEFGDEPVHSIPFNEADQAIEHGGQDYHYGGHIFQWNEHPGLSVIADWLSRYADAHRAIRPQDILHLPACSAGMNRNVYHEAMPTEKFDRWDIHVYRIQDVDLWVPKVFVSECGLQNGTPEQIAVLLKSLGHTDFAWWKWTEPQRESNPEGDPAGYAISHRPDVVEVFVNQESAPESNVVIYEDELKEWPKEDKVPDTTLFPIWYEEYCQAHNGMSPSEWEFRKHELAIDTNLPVTLEDIKAVEQDEKAAYKQSELLRQRYVEGGSAPAPFQPVVIYEWTDNHGGTREKTDLIIIHSSRSGKKRTAEQELASTRSWFANPKAQASAQAAIAANGDIYLFVPAEQVSWGATYLNERAINIELVQARIEIPFTDEQYTSLAWLLKEWTGLFGVPYVRIMDENERGIIGHEDSAQGQSYGKSDPGYMLDWSRIGL